MQKLQFFCKLRKSCELEKLDCLCEKILVQNKNVPYCKKIAKIPDNLQKLGFIIFKPQFVQENRDETKKFVFFSFCHSEG